MSNCSNHKKDLFGETDMKKVAEAIGDSHYKLLSLLLYHLREKLWKDGVKDAAEGRVKLGEHLMQASTRIAQARIYIEGAWKISKPFMEPKNKKS